MWYRSYALEVFRNQGIAATDPLPASRRSIYRWNQRVVPYQMTGNNPQELLIGNSLLLLTMANFIFLDATADKTTAFILNNGGGVYLRQDIYTRLSEL